MSTFPVKTYRKSEGEDGMLKKTGLLSLLLLWGSLKVGWSYEESGKTFNWYDNGQEQKWLGYADAQVVKFRKDADLVHIFEKPGIGRKANQVSGKPLTILPTEVDLTGLEASVEKIYYLAQIPGWEQLPEDHRYVFLDNRLLISFKNNRPSIGEAEAFAVQNGLELFHYPKPGTGDVLIFSIPGNPKPEEIFAKPSEVFSRNSERIKSIQPNRVEFFKPNTNDLFLSRSWHLRNDAQQIWCFSKSGTQYADAAVADAWKLGITGQGIKVGIIDFFGFDYNHPDMEGRFISGWDCINNQPYDASNFYYVESNQAHGMAVAGIIAANGDNFIGSAGVAYKSQLVPLLIDGSEASVVIAFQKAMEQGFDADVINCSFGVYYESPFIKEAIEYVQEYGRVRNGQAKGIVVVASHGNDNFSDLQISQYPSGYESVISVGATTPQNQKKNPNDSWDTADIWGSNFGQKLDFAAPGVCIFTTDYSNGAGYAQGDYVALNKTSSAAPVVSGIVALTLSANPDLTWQQVRQKLRNSSKKVQQNGAGYNYNHDPERPGHSLEVGYGVINAFKSVEDFVGTTLLPGQNENQVTMNTLIDNQLVVQWQTGSGPAQWDIEIRDLSGRTILSETKTGDRATLDFNNVTLSQGNYLVAIASRQKLIAVEKVFKR